MDEISATRRKSASISLSSLGVILCEEDGEASESDEAASSSAHSQSGAVSFLHGHIDPVISTKSPSTSMDLGEMKQ